MLYTILLYAIRKVNGMGRLIDLSGRKFGRLKVVKRVGSNPKGKATWLCACTCGVEKVVIGQSLIQGDTKSCGCFNRQQKKLVCKQRNTTHNLRRTRIYNIWSSLRS